MGCSSCKLDSTIDSTKNAKDVIKKKYKIEGTLIGDGVFGKVFLASKREGGEAKFAIKAIAK